MHTPSEMMPAKCTNVLFTFRNILVLCIVVVHTYSRSVGSKVLSKQCSDLLVV